jgi:1,4-dihydroxy-2-naphthoate octaprenyltransferase
LGTSIAWVRNGAFNLEYFSLALVGGIFLHLGTNVINDYFDYKSGNDEINKEFVRPFSGGSRTIQMRLLSPREVFVGAILFYIVGTVIGLYLTWVRGPFVLVLGLVGLLSGFFYVAPPLNWAGRGFGEVIVGINFGCLVTLGAYYVQTQTLTFEPILASIPVALLISAVLYINEFPDYVADKAVGKNTLVVRLGRRKAVLGYALIVLGAYVAIILSAIGGVTPIQTMVALVPLPLAMEAVLHAEKFHSKSFNLIPSNALTVVCHLFTSVMLSIGYLMYSLEILTPGYILVVLVFVISALFTFFSYFQIRRQKHFIKDET